MVRRPLHLALCGLLAGSLATGALHAVAAPKDDKAVRGSLADRSFANGRTTVAPDVESIDSVRPVLDKALDNRWEAFHQSLGGSWSGDVDKRSGNLSYAEGAGIPWVPGRGNDLGDGDLKALSPNGRVDLAVMERAARAFLPSVAAMLGVDPSELVLNQAASGQPASHVWFLDFNVERDGMAIEGAHVVFRVNNGNLIQFGSENLPALGVQAPPARVAKAAARQALGDLIGGFLPGDQWVDRGSLHLLPANLVDESELEGYRFAKGRGLQLLWQFTFKRAGEPGTWRGRVDATSGEVVELYDVNHYGTATGATYKADRPAAEVVMPLPWANVATGVYTNSAGIFSGTTGTTTLNGQFVAITDSCGSISKAADGSGVLAMGSSAGTDCTIPATGGGAGNTHAARTQFYMVNRGKEAARGWLPSNSWLNAKVTAKVNLNQTCNAYWDGSTLNFFRSGGGCANTGELPGVSLHEWGHGMDNNDGNGSSPDNGTGETYGDVSAMLAIHSSCTGNGFLASNCGGYGNACTSCTGVRDGDWAKHVRNTPSTVDNFTRTTCPAPTQFPTYVGPCGADAIARGGGTTLRREGHCESLVSTEAVWDLANRDLPSPGSGSAWATLDRLWFLSRSTATAAFTCNTSGGNRTSGTWTSSGCSTGSLFRVFRAVDDDNGNLADGTPHGGAIAAAMNRHGIACTTDAGWNVTFRAVAQPAVPALSVTGGSNSAALSWSGSSGVYDVYRNETGCNAGFTKVASDLAAASFNDTAVANGFTYYYQVTAQPSGNEAAASSPSTCVSVTPAGAACTPPAAPTGVVATAASSSQINLSWTAAAGATSYTILRATTSGGPYTVVGTSATTSFANTGLACNTTYYYVVQASNGTCSSGNSAQASALTSACTGNVLTKGVPVTGISGATASQQFWTLTVPAGSTNLTFNTSGGSGDVDLYVRFGSQPTTTVNDCKSEGSATTESCTIPAPSAGTYHVLLYGYAAYSGVSLTGNYSTPCIPPAAPTGVTATAASSSQINVSWTASSGATSYTILRSTSSGGPFSSVGTSATTSFSNTGLACNTTYYYVVTASNGTCSSGNSAQGSGTTSACAGNVLTNGVPVTGISGATGSQQTWTMAVPAGATNLTIAISGGTGDADMYVRFGAPPTLTTYDCRPYKTGNAESCPFPTPGTGTYYVMLNGYAAYSGVTLTGNYSTGGGCTTYTGSLTSGGQAYVPTSSGYATTTTGTHTGVLAGPAGTDFDLYLQKLSGSTWSNVASGTTATPNENVTYSNGTAGSYRWRVHAYSGSGSWSLCTTKPN